MQAVLIKRNADSSVEIIKRGEYPNIEMEPIQGLDPDLEWLLVHQPFVEPEYDPRVYILEKTEAITQEAHPQYSHLKQFKVTFSLAKRQVADIQVAVTNAESVANENLIPYDKRLKLLTLGLAVLFRKTAGTTLLTKEVAIKEAIEALGARVWKNDANAKAMISAIASGAEPDLDASWEKQ